jgi:exopolyphosphatase/guanosine-5'-triphosphate,3'-diphosphate pyrophosphatase
MNGSQLLYQKIEETGLVMKIASIDIGTNTILMLIAETEGPRISRIMRDEHAIARLGKGVDRDRCILPETFQRVLRYIESYRKIASKESVQTIVACGTSALRDAANRDEFIEFIFKRSGIKIRILSGEEEAAMTYSGALWGFPDSGSIRGVLDIGGGSTELIFGRERIIEKGKSIDIGSVRLTERILRKSPPDPEALMTAREYVRNQLKLFPPMVPDSALYGVAGTLTTLAALDQNLDGFNAEKIHGYRLRRENVDSIFERLQKLTLPELLNVPSMVPDRADIILGGILILQEVLRKLSAPEIFVSTQGLRYGILLDAIK